MKAKNDFDEISREMRCIKVIEESLKYSNFYIENYTYPGMYSDDFESHQRAYKMKVDKLREIDEARVFLGEIKNNYRR
jgi:hypothetical protein